MPVAGKPFNTTVPEGISQFGCVTLSMVGVEGAMGCALIITSADGSDIHPAALVTLKL